MRSSSHDCSSCNRAGPLASCRRPDRCRRSCRGLYCCMFNCPRAACRHFHPARLDCPGRAALSGVCGATSSKGGCDVLRRVQSAVRCWRCCKALCRSRNAGASAGGPGGTVLHVVLCRAASPHARCGAAVQSEAQAQAPSGDQHCLCAPVVLLAPAPAPGPSSQATMPGAATACYSVITGLSAMHVHLGVGQPH